MESFDLHFCIQCKQMMLWLCRSCYSLYPLLILTPHLSSPIISLAYSLYSSQSLDFYLSWFLPMYKKLSLYFLSYLAYSLFRCSSLSWILSLSLPIFFYAYVYIPSSPCLCPSLSLNHRLTLSFLPTLLSRPLFLPLLIIIFISYPIFVY